MADRYDVILVGINVDESERDETISNIANTLEADEEDIRQLVDSQTSAPVKEGVSMEAARKYQADILRYGGISNFRPSSKPPSVKLELTPIEPPDETVVFTCPACQYKQEVPNEKELPLQCPQCGIIPSKYDRVAALKEERERIKQRLLNAQKLREQQDRADIEKQDAEERQRRLEEEIRKELGLPRLINTRLRLFSSAAGILLLGMGMGGGAATVVYKSLAAKAAEQAAANNMNASQDDGQQQPNNDPNIPPQQDTLKQVFSFSHRRYVNKKDGVEQVEQASQQDAATGGKPQGGVKTSNLDPNAIWQDVGQDGEWDLYLADQAKKLVDSQQAPKAYHLANAIASPRLKAKALGQIAEHFHKLNNIADGENMFNLMATYINGLPDINERIETQGILALSLWRMGDHEKAGQNLDAAEKLALTLNNPVDSARSLARVASYQSQTGKKADADANFRRVNTIIHSISDKATLLSAYIKLATSYGESGSRGIALAILNETQTATQEQIKDKTEQNRLFQEIADAFVKLGDADSAMAAAGKLGPDQRDKAMYTVTRELAYADRLYDAMKSLDGIVSPEYKARAAALVSRLQHAHADMAAISAASQEKALAAQGQITSPPDQSIVRGEFARYQAHIGQPQAAEEWAKKALTSAQAIDSAQERDSVYAVLSANFTRANLAKLAEDAKKMIVAPSLAELVDRENAKIARLFGAM